MHVRDRSFNLDKRLLILAGVLALAQCGVVIAQTDAGSRAWWPQQYTVSENKAAGALVLSTPYYTIQHDLRRGGWCCLWREEPPGGHGFRWGSPAGLSPGRASA